MPLISSEDFADILKTDDLEIIVQEHIFKGETFVFGDNPELYDSLRGIISQGVGLTPESVILVGSAKLGFSLDPSKFGAPFTNNSDLDLLVVSPKHFDQLWIDFLRWHREHEKNIGLLTRANLSDHRRDIYWGRIHPAKLTQIIDSSAVWFDVIRGLGRYPRLARWKASVRIYRSWQHATLSQISALKEIALTLT